MATDLAPEILDLLDNPSPAVLTTYRKDGTAATSPVWFRRAGDVLEVVIARGDVKLRHLAARPQCALLVFEAIPPFRGIRVEGTPTLDDPTATEARRSIAGRYLGHEAGTQFTDSRKPGTLIRLSLTTAHAWNLTSILPS